MELHSEGKKEIVFGFLILLLPIKRTNKSGSRFFKCGNFKRKIPVGKYPVRTGIKISFTAEKLNSVIFHWMKFQSGLWMVLQCCRRNIDIKNQTEMNNKKLIEELTGLGNGSLLVIGISGLKRINCPFKVICREFIHIHLPGDVLFVR